MSCSYLFATAPKQQGQLRLEILLVLTVFFLAVTPFMGRAALHLPLHPSEQELILAAQSLAADQDLRITHADQERISQMGHDTLGPLPHRQIRMVQPVYSVVASPFVLLLGDAGFMFCNALALVALLWASTGGAHAKPEPFWWALTYFLICAYPVLVFRLDEGIFLGALLYAIVCSWGERRPFLSGLLMGFLLPGHEILAPLALLLAYERGRRFFTPVAVIFAAALLFDGMPADPPEPSERVALLAAAAPELVALAQDATTIKLDSSATSNSGWLEQSDVVLAFLGRAQGMFPYFLPFWIGFFQFWGYERSPGRRRKAMALLLSLCLGILAPLPANVVWGPAHPALTLLLPAFFLFSHPVTQMRSLVFVWGCSSLFTAALFLNPIHTAAFPEQLLTNTPHRYLPLETSALDPRRVPMVEVVGQKAKVILPGSDAGLYPGGSIFIRGKRPAHLLLQAKAGAYPDFIVRSLVDQTLHLGALLVSLKAKQPTRITWASQPETDAVELIFQTTAGLVPRLETDAGDGVEYIGVELWLTSPRENE